MGRLLYFTITTILLAGTVKPSGFYTESIKELAQNVRELVLETVKSVNDDVESALQPIRLFASKAVKRTRALFISIREIAKALQNRTNQELKNLTQDVSNAVEDHINSVKDTIDEMNGEILDTIRDIFNYLPLLEPDVLRNEIDKIVTGRSPVTGLILSLNLMCNDEDPNLLNEIVQALNDYPMSENDLNELVKRVLNNCVVGELNNMSPEAREKLQKGMNRILQYVEVRLGNDSRAIDLTLSNTGNDASKIDDGVENVFDTEV